MKNINLENFSKYQITYSDEKGLQIYSLYRNRYIKFFKNDKGYLYVKLSSDTKTVKKFYIHRLVSLLIPNPNNLPQINHIDSNKENNKLENLEFVTNYGNSYHRSLNAKNNTSKYVGVSYNEPNKKWVSRISNTALGKYEYLGYFFTEEQASKAYESRAKELGLK